MRKSFQPKPFYFRNFIIYQDKCAMKVGTDGMLLGALANVESAKKILDIGTGSGLLALMLAQRSKAQIDAVEINENAFNQAKENFENSAWRHRIKVFHTRLQDFLPYIDDEKNAYDLIISNPPFFEETNSVKSKAQNISRATARDHGTLNFSDLCFHTSRLLIVDGVFYVIIPFAETDNFIAMADRNGLQLSENISIRSKPSKPFHRSILAFVKTGKPQVVNSRFFTIYEENGLYTNEYLLATQLYHAADVSRK